MASQDNMNPTPQAHSPFPPDVEAFTKAYLAQSSLILPIFAPNASHASSVTTQGVVIYQLPSALIDTNSPAYNAGITEKDIVHFRSHFKESLNAAPDLGHLTPVKGLGITGASQISAPFTSSEFHHHVASDRNDLSTPKNRTKGESSNGTAFARSPTTPSTFTVRTKSESALIKQKRELGLDPSKLKSGFTPLIKQQESTCTDNNHPRKKIRLSVKGSSNQTTPTYTPTACFGSPLHPVKGQDESTFVQSSSNIQANSSNVGRQEALPHKGQKFTFLALNSQHAERLRIQMEKQLPPEMLELVEIKTIAQQAQASSAAKQPCNTQLALAKPQKQRLIAFDEQHAANMRKSMTPQMRDTFEIVFISQLQPGARPRAIIKLTTSRHLTTATTTSHGPLKEFHLFPSLPTELQHQIWTLTLPGPRTLHLRTPTHPSLSIFLPNAPPPVTLQICSQSRTIALQTLRPAFQNSCLLGAYTYFNFSQDILRLGDGNNVEAAKKMALATDPGVARDRKRVRHLEIPLRIMHTRHMYNCLAVLICLAPARGWPGIRTLTFTGEGGNGGVPRRMAVVEVVKGSEEKMGAMVGEMVEVIWGEFREVWGEGEVVVDCGLKVVYLEEGEE